MTASMEHNEPTEAAIASSNVTTAIATEITLAERLESLKAGFLGALAAGLVLGLLMLMNGWLSLQFVQLATLSIGVDPLRLLINEAIAALSGFLFGVTYRYIIRQDQNSHLKDGAVLAFGLVRGLAQVEGQLDQSIVRLPLVVLVIESILLFTAIRLVLDGALRVGWVEPFGTQAQTANRAVDKPFAPSPYSVKSSNSG